MFLYNKLEAEEEYTTIRHMAYFRTPYCTDACWGSTGDHQSWSWPSACTRCTLPFDQEFLPQARQGGRPFCTPLLIAQLGSDDKDVSAWPGLTTRPTAQPTRHQFSNRGISTAMMHQYNVQNPPDSAWYFSPQFDGGIVRFS